MWRDVGGGWVGESDKNERRMCKDEVTSRELTIMDQDAVVWGGATTAQNGCSIQP